MNVNDIIMTIKERRSIRKFKAATIPEKDILMILEAGRWAPSGLNNQPWRFSIIESRNIKDAISELTSYGSAIKASFCCIAVFYHIPSGYNRDKDLMGIGACIQNMLLAATSLGIGSVWLGEILNRKKDFNDILGISGDHELMAVIALGSPGESPKGVRMSMKKLLLPKR